MKVKCTRDSELKGLRKGRIEVWLNGEIVYRARFFALLCSKRRIARLKRRALRVAERLVA